MVRMYFEELIEHAYMDKTQIYIIPYLKSGTELFFDNYSLLNY